MLKNAKRIVIKIGSSLIANEEAGDLRALWLGHLVADIAALQAAGKEVIVVTSGAVALGRLTLKLGKQKLSLEEKQAAAACGQIALISAWQSAFSQHSISTAQLLLTADDSIDRRRYLNARNTLETLLALRAIPIINENDTVATAELRFGDNDRLAARVAQMSGADILILFSDIDGLYSADPRHHKDAEFIETVQDITPAIEAMAGGVGSNFGSGGMATKIAAAKIATGAGCHMIIARGDVEHPLEGLQKGAKHTRFVAHETPKSARKNWISGSMHATGSVIVDDGAATALGLGKSLLPAGVRAIEGTFERGDTVLIFGAAGALLGKGLIAYGHADTARILGKQSGDIEAILGFKGRDVLIHRDDMVLE